MEKFEIIIDKRLKEQMQKYDTDWSEVCRQAIQEELDRLANDQTNVKDLIDTDVDNVTSVQNQSEIQELPRQVYKIFEKAWNEVFYEFPKDSHVIPSSSKLKKWWKNWYNPENFYEIYAHDNLELAYPPFNEHGELDNLADDGFITDQNLLVEEFYRKAEEIDLDVWGHYEYTYFVYFISRFLFDGKILDFDEIDPFIIESVEIENKDNLPEESGIYFVRDDENLYYIGMTKNLQERWYDHHRQDDFDKINNLKIAYLKGIPQHYLKRMETTLIEYFKPKLNIKDNPLLKK